MNTLQQEPTIFTFRASSDEYGVLPGSNIILERL